MEPVRRAALFDELDNIQGKHQLSAQAVTHIKKACVCLNEHCLPGPTISTVYGYSSTVLRMLPAPTPAPAPPAAAAPATGVPVLRGWGRDPALRQPRQWQELRQVCAPRGGVTAAIPRRSSRLPRRAFIHTWLANTRAHVAGR
jgi:hypothetical protein